MQISDDIKGFPPLMAVLLHNVLTEEFDQRCQRRLKLRPQEWLVVLLVGKGNQITATALAQLVGFHKSTLSRMVLRLETQRIIRRQPVSADRRFEALVLTNSGATLFRALTREIQFFEARCAALMDDMPAWSAMSAQWLDAAPIMADVEE